MPVHRAELGNGQRICRNLPREPEAEDHVRLVAAEERRDSGPLGGDHDVELGWSLAQKLFELAVPLGHCAGGEERDRLVPARAEHSVEAVDSREDPRYQDDSHPRSKYRVRSQSVTTLS